MLGHFPFLSGHLLVVFYKSNLWCKNYVYSVLTLSMFRKKLWWIRNYCWYGRSSFLLWKTFIFNVCNASI